MVVATAAAVTIQYKKETKQLKLCIYTTMDHATFTVQIGPKSDICTYNIELEVRKDGY
jgi:hypothetical protein